MSRSFSEHFLSDLFSKREEDNVGEELAKVCMTASLPAIHVADILGVSRMTIHHWYRGRPLRNKNLTKARALIKLIAQDLADGNLPIKSPAEAQEYARNAEQIFNKPTIE